MSLWSSTPSPSLPTELVYGAMLGAGCRADLSSSAAPIVLPHADANVQAAMSVPIAMILDVWCAILHLHALDRA